MKLKLKNYLTLAEIRKYMLSEKNPRKKTYWNIIFTIGKYPELNADGLAIKLDCNKKKIYRVLQAYNKKGIRFLNTDDNWGGYRGSAIPKVKQQFILDYIKKTNTVTIVELRNKICENFYLDISYNNLKYFIHKSKIEKVWKIPPIISREENDFYCTPPEAVTALLSKENFRGKIWECACGDGSISKVLIENGYKVYSSDLIDRNYGDVGIDFLKYDGKSFKNIVSNPPYRLSLEFIHQAKKYSENKFAFLMRTSFLESNRRREMFEDKQYPLKAVYQFSKRISIYKNGVVLPNQGKTAYAFFVWQKEGVVGQPILDWI